MLRGKNPPRTHDLDELCKLCSETHDGFGKIADQCSDLTAYDVQTRYPMGLTLEERDMSQALNSAPQTTSMDGFIQREGSSPSSAATHRSGVRLVEPVVALGELHIEPRKEPASTASVSDLIW
ncbi:MAG: HEPN domain-containing protein [Clostridia bacterium]|nr:HEPN domain-containing protein [Clostridia bacterium]